MPLTRVLQLLEDAATAPDRAAAISLALPAIEEPAVARYVQSRAHLAIRGGARTLLREALAEVEGSPVRRAAEAMLEANGDLGIRLRRRATTRVPPLDDGRAFTVETGGNIVGDVAFVPDGSRIVAFVWGPSAWDEAISGSWLGQWDARTGELVEVSPAGQFREESGTFAVNPSMTLLAVRSHRSIDVHELDGDGRVLRRVRRTLVGTEGPNRLTFVDDARLVGDDGSELVLYDAETGSTLARSPSIGSWSHAAAPRLGRIFVAGSGAFGSCVASHVLPSLELVATAEADDTKGHAARGARTMWALALSPSEQWLASGDRYGDVRIWKARDIVRGEPRTPEPATARIVGRHDGWVSALAFADESRLLSGGWDGAVLDWNLAATPVQARELVGHAGYVTACAVDPASRRAVSCASDGKIIVWDLAREGASPRPPFAIPYGSWLPPVALRVTSDRVLVAVGDREVAFDHEGTVIETTPWVPPPEAKAKLGGVIRVDGFRSEDIVLTVAELAYPDDGASAPSLEVSDDSGVVDSLILEARALAFAWVDAQTLVVLDVGGHVSFWSLTRV